MEYSKDGGVHIASFHRNIPAVMNTIEVKAADHCKVFAEEHTDIEQWKCNCGNDTFRVYHKDCSTMAKCTQCENESEIHEG